MARATTSRTNPERVYIAPAGTQEAGGQTDGGRVAQTAAAGGSAPYGVPLARYHGRRPWDD